MTTEVNNIEKEIKRKQKEILLLKEEKKRKLSKITYSENGLTLCEEPEINFEYNDVPTDFVLKIGPFTLNCHKLILVNICSWFRTWIFVEKLDSKVQEPEGVINTIIIYHLIKYAYNKHEESFKYPVDRHRNLESELASKLEDKYEAYAMLKHIEFDKLDSFIETTLQEDHFRLGSEGRFRDFSYPYLTILGKLRLTPRSRYGYRNTVETDEFKNWLTTKKDVYHLNNKDIKWILCERI
jgi:hypothetical protein